VNEESLLTRCPVLHRDRFLLVVNKPSGVLSHPNPGRRGEVAAFEGRYNERTQCFESSAGRVWLMHRLDQDTSGVLLGALDAGTAAKCREAFEAGAMAKTYLAAVRGNPGREGVWLDHLATTHERGRVRTAVVKGRPPNAELHFRNRIHDPARRLSLLEIALLTGKTHQIRVQAASRQHHLLGDDVYGHFELNRRLRAEVGLKRLFLHAARLEFKHPASGHSLRIEAPLPEDLATVRSRLGLG
jgi:RluA family pseudouridine synthase